MLVDSDTLQLVQETAVKAAGVDIKPIPGDPDHVVISQNGAYEIRSVPPARIAHKVLSLDDLVCFVKKFEEQEEEERPKTIWHDRDRVVVLLNERDRRDCVEFALVPSEALKLLRALETPGNQAIFQAAFVRMLKIDFGVNAALVAIFRTLDFKRGDEAHGDIQHGRESLGKSVQAAVQGTAAIPEDLILNVPLYSSVGEDTPYQIRCAVEINPIQNTFKLTPFPNELETVIHAHQATIHDRLVTDLPGAGVFYGSP